MKDAKSEIEDMTNLLLKNSTVCQNCCDFHRDICNLSATDSCNEWEDTYATCEILVNAGYRLIDTDAIVREAVQKSLQKVFNAIPYYDGEINNPIQPEFVRAIIKQEARQFGISCQREKTYMSETRNDDKTLCIHCGEYHNYYVLEELSTIKYRGVEVQYLERKAYCNKCNSRIDIDGLWDSNLERIQEAYNKAKSGENK